MNETFIKNFSKIQKKAERFLINIKLTMNEIIFKHLIWCGEFNKYIFEIENLCVVGINFAFRFLFSESALPNFIWIWMFLCFNVGFWSLKIGIKFLILEYILIIFRAFFQLNQEPAELKISDIQEQFMIINRKWPRSKGTTYLNIEKARCMLFYVAY